MEKLDIAKLNQLLEEVLEDYEDDFEEDEEDDFEEFSTLEAVKEAFPDLDDKVQRIIAGWYEIEGANFERKADLVEYMRDDILDMLDSADEGEDSTMVRNALGIDESLNEGKLFYLAFRSNPQLKNGGYYMKLGQLTKKEAKAKEKPIYGHMSLTPYETEEEYKKAIADLEAKGKSVR